MKNLTKMMQQASQMQTRMKEAQEKLSDLRVEGDAGNGLVKIIMTGKGEMKDLKIDPKLVDPEDIETLQDLIIGAYEDARKKSKAAEEEEMKKVTGGMDLPPGFDLPF